MELAIFPKKEEKEEDFYFFSNAIDFIAIWGAR
jgi:hypothetical protein